MEKREKLVEQLAKNGLCALCKGTKMLCGKSECPLLVRYYSMLKTNSKLKKQIYGSSPPGIFVGRFGYPKVYVGPLVPPKIGNTEYMDIPESWINMNIKEFTQMRTSLVRGMKKIKIDNALNPDYLLLSLQEMSMAENHVDSEVVFDKIPKGKLIVGSEIQPFGPAGKMIKMEHGNIKVNSKIEKFYYDELPARDSIIKLYEEGVRVSLIQRAFSTGTMGIQRKLVPTRWSITAVDDTISNKLVEEVKEYPLIDKTLVFKSYKMGNLFVVIFLPRSWSYELVEAWYPGTLWNPYGTKTFMVSSHEFYQGRKGYAEIGGCYYAAKLAVAEKLKLMKRQAEVIILREAQPDYIMPVGVWHVRENVRNALRKNPLNFDNEREALNYALSQFHISEKFWIKGSALLKRFTYQRRIDDFEIH